MGKCRKWFCCCIPSKGDVTRNSNMPVPYPPTHNPQQNGVVQDIEDLHQNIEQLSQQLRNKTEEIQVNNEGIYVYVHHLFDIQALKP